MDSAALKKELRLQQVPVLHVRGDFQQVGLAIGRTFRGFIQDVIKAYDFLENLLVPAYQTLEGRQIYDGTLALCMRKFPGYVEELEGIAIGAEIPFFKLFLLQIEGQIIPNAPSPEVDKFAADKLETGCSCLLSYPNKETILLGHTEDARKALRNNIFILDAEILGKNGEKVEKFTTLCYSAALPGFTMGYNEHGLYHSMNTLVPVNVYPYKTPVPFIMRGLLGAKSLNDAMDILKDQGSGAADGFSVNFVYTAPGTSPVLQNVEVAPPNPGELESRFDVFPVKFGESYAHCNKYIRMNVEQHDDKVIGSEKRHEAIAKYSKPYDLNCVRTILSETSNPSFPVFRGNSDKETGSAATVAVGIFDIANKKWYIYTEPPAHSSPVATLPIELTGQ